MKKFLLSLCLTIFILSLVCTVNAAQMYYTFEGTITVINDGAGIIADAGLELGSKVSYTFLIDVDMAGTYTKNDGTVYPAPIEDNFYTDYISGSILQEKDGGYYNAPDDTAEINYGLWRFSNTCVNGGSRNSNIFLQMWGAPFDEWEVGSTGSVSNTAWDSAGNYSQLDAQDLILTEISPVTYPPTAIPGSDRVVFDSVTFDGSGSSDTDGTIIFFEWLLQHREDPNNNRTVEGINPTISDLEPGFYDVVLTVTDNDGLTGTDTMLLAAAGSCDCVASTMHIQSIIAGIAPASKNWKYGQVTVTIFDDCGIPVSGAEVTGTFTGDFDETLTITTNNNGVAVITTSTQAKKPSYTFCMIDVTHSSLTYDSNDDVETCKSK